MINSSKTTSTSIFKGKGFTLIELVLVILIGGILSISAIPRFFDLVSFSENTFYNDVLSSVKYAQKLAVGMGCDVEVAITSTTLTLQTRASCTSGSFTQAIRDPGFGGSTFVKTAPSSVTLSSSELPIYFDRLGRARLVSTDAISNATLTVNAKDIDIIGETGFTYDPS